MTEEEMKHKELSYMSSSLPLTSGARDAGHKAGFNKDDERLGAALLAGHALTCTIISTVPAAL